MTNLEIAEKRSPSQLRPSKLGVVCEGLLFKIFPHSASAVGQRFVVAFTSAHSGAGVTEITRTLAKELRHGGEHVATSLSFRSLIQDELNFNDCATTSSAGNYRGRSAAESEGEERHGQAIQAILTNALQTLRLRHRYVLVDCAPINDAQDVIRLAPLVDGIVVVAEANKTKRDQIQYAEKAIEAAQGRILGYILNKRTYAIPNWFNHIVTAFGF